MSSEQDADRCFRADVQMEMPAMFALRDPSVGKEHFDRFGINEPQRSGQAGMRRGAPGHQRHQARRHAGTVRGRGTRRSEEHKSELQSLMRISYAVFCLKKQKT